MNVNTTTKLDAVNTMLFTIGESPVNTLEGGNVVDAVTAEQTLDRVSREVQSSGWSFNHEKNFPLNRDSTSLNFLVPDTALSCDPSDKSRGIVVRAGKLYDLKNHTFTFSDDTQIECDIIWNFSFEDLPETAKRFITIRAARIYQAGAVSSETLNAFTDRDEFEAKVRFRKDNARVLDKNLLTSNYSVARILAR